MGMSSSQARLLNLTSRMHQIEYKAAKLEAQKLQMANESRRVYTKYLNALETVKIRANSMGSNGSISPVDLTLNMALGNTGSLDQTYYLRELSTDKLFITNDLVTLYNLDAESGIVPASMADFLTNAGFPFIYTEFNPAIANTPENINWQGVSCSVVPGSTREVPDRPADVGFQDSIFGQANVSGLSMASAVAANSFVQNGTYVINEAAELVQLADLVNYGVDTTGVTFILNSDIDMSSYTDWYGIGMVTSSPAEPNDTEGNAFKGTFDGNYHKVTGLSGKQGLFDYARGATFKNIQLTGANIDHSSGTSRTIATSNGNKTAISGGNTGAGILVGTAVDCQVTNAYVSGTVTTTKWSGGVIGNGYGNTVTNATSAANVTASGSCNGGLIGHDTNGTLKYCLATGNVSGNKNIGGLIGHEYGGGTGTIQNCAATGTVTSSNSTKGTFIGKVEGSASITNSQYTPQGSTKAVGSGFTYSGTGTLDPSGVRTVTTGNITLPAKSSIISNFTTALKKYNGSTPSAEFLTQMNTWLDRIYTRNMAYSTENEPNPVLVDEALLLASINEYLVDYLRDGSSSGVIQAMIQDINNMDLSTNSATKNYQDKFSSPNFEYTVYGVGGPNGTAVRYSDITTGSTTNIGQNLYTALRKAGHTDLNQESRVINWINDYYSTGDANQLEAAEINYLATSYLAGTNNDTGRLNQIYSAITSNSYYTTPAANRIYNAENTTYRVHFSDQPQEGTADYDYADPEVLKAITFYNTVKDSGFIVVDEDDANSNKWFSNALDSGAAVLSEVDLINGIVEDTSVAVNTELSSVPDESELRKIEAEYEADMRKIDKKDSKYDADLAALDTERNAIKSEIETLKTVARDNVERTFKLFS